MKTLVLLIVTIIPAFAILSDEPKAPVLSAEALLTQTELNVLTRQYEKALTEFHEVRLQIQLLPIMERSQQQPKEEIARQGVAMDMRLKLLAEWQDDIRHRIVRLVAEQNAREKESQRQDPKTAPTPAVKAPSKSEHAPRPQL
jgi:hypothetical protein